ncbi:hypothetical protein AAFN60_14065 [Roseibacillus persicicus]|uniref:hypothetical protein n=1 Tax=Roseibacillus persicicus TaxID=454148 RepID=UPI00398AD4EE
MKKHLPKSFLQSTAVATPCLLAVVLASNASAASLLIVNPSFEADTPGSSGASAVLGASGWTITSAGTSGNGDWFTTTAGLTHSSIDPDAAAEGSNWLSGNRLAGGFGSTSDPATIVQLVDISADSSLVDQGTATVNLDFMFSDSDPADLGLVNITFYSDIAGTSELLGTSLTTGVITPTAADGTGNAPWAARSLSGAVPATARSLQIEIVNDRTSGSAGNTHFDAFTGSIIPEPSVALLGGLGLFSLLRRKR